MANFSSQRGGGYGRPEKGVEDFRAVLKMEVSDRLKAQVWCELSSENFKAGNLAAAEKEARQAVALDPDHGGSRFNLGLCLIACGKAAEGLAEYKAGVATWSKSQLKEGCEDLEALMKKSPGVAGAKEALAIVKGRLAELDKLAK